MRPLDASDMANPQIQQPSPLWSYIRLGEYTAPAGLATETAHQGLEYLWNRLRNFGGRSDSQSDPSQAELDSLPEAILDQVASRPNWTEAAFALGKRLSEWWSTSQRQSIIQVIVGAPGSGIAQIATEWARSQRWSIVEPPSPAQVLSNDDGWLEGILQGQEPCVFLPRLERYFLRHPDGTSLIRKLFERVLNGSGRYVIECGSWGWAYLTMALDVDGLLPEPITLEAFDHMRLERWFWSLCSGHEELAFRQVDNKKAVLTPLDVLSEGDDTEKSDFLRRLAACSRGIPAVAWTIWRHSLRGASRGASDGPGDDAKQDDGRRTLWVQPWSRLDLPTVPEWAGQRDQFVLHALLVHGGLPARILQEVLPMAPADVVRVLHRLNAAGLLQRENETWQVSPAGYPAVRQYLNNEGYLVDAF